MPLPAGNDSAQIDGGQPLDLGQADLFLCARADKNSTRFFSGSLAHLGVWDVALEADEVRSCLSNLAPAVFWCCCLCPARPGLPPSAAGFTGALCRGAGSSCGQWPSRAQALCV